MLLNLPDEDDLEPWTEAEVAVSATPEDLKREDRRVSRPPADPDAPPPLATPPEAACPKPVEEAPCPELRLFVLLPQDS